MKDWFRERFHGLYWRQMAVTVGMVFLTLVLLGVSFFSLSYSCLIYTYTIPRDCI